MLNQLLLLILLLEFTACNEKQQPTKNTILTASSNICTQIAAIPTPNGFERIKTDSGTFAYYLQHLPLKKDNTVYYYNDAKKENQYLHYAVIDLPIGNKDLQQCADCIMRLRATYFFARKEYAKIEFKSNTEVFNFATYRHNIDCTEQQLPNVFISFMERVFANCGTYNLQTLLHPKNSINNIVIGDVLVKGGSPGHAMIVVDVAINKKTNDKIYLLAQGFMPAQSMHVVINPVANTLSPWYKADSSANNIITPGYIFSCNNLRSWDIN